MAGNAGALLHAEFPRYLADNAAKLSAAVEAPIGRATKPRSARRLFSKANVARARHDYPDASESELKIILHEMWNRLPAHAREEYERGAADELERYNREMAEYQTEEPGAL